jgi:hypothetical protein
VSHVAEDASHGSGVASQFVGNESAVVRNPDHARVFEKSLGGALIMMPLDQNVDHVAILIHGAPQIPLLAVDANETSSKCQWSPSRPSRRFNRRA